MHTFRINYSQHYNLPSTDNFKNSWNSKTNIAIHPLPLSHRLNRSIPPVCRTGTEKWVRLLTDNIYDTQSRMIAPKISELIRCIITSYSICHASTHSAGRKRANIKLNCFLYLLVSAELSLTGTLGPSLSYLKSFKNATIKICPNTHRLGSNKCGKAKFRRDRSPIIYVKVFMIYDSNVWYVKAFLLYWWIGQ